MKQTIIFELEVDESTGGLTLQVIFDPGVGDQQEVMDKWLKYAEMEMAGMTPPVDHQLALRILAVGACAHMRDAVAVFKGEQPTPVPVPRPSGERH